MAKQEEIEATYDWFDQFQIMVLGDYADITCAFFDGDFTKTLNQAQKDKHDYVLKGINFKSGDKILDIGSGRGPMLHTIEKRGGEAIGFTLSSWQAKYCQERGLNAKIQDYKTADPKQFQDIDGIVSIGALEHFCSIEDLRAGKQDQIYKNFFKFCADVLPKGKRLYLHMMVWGKKVPNPNVADRPNPNDPEEMILYRTSKFFPGSWLPNGKEQLIEAAKPYFKFLSTNDGRLDYIETLNRWKDAMKKLRTTKKIIPAAIATAKLIPRYLFSSDFRTQIAYMRNHDQEECFKREIMGHERMFFERI